MDPELAIAVIHCEGARYKKVGNNKNYRDGVHWSTDIGWFQINDYYHDAHARVLKLDIHNDRHNIIYGVWLMSKEGTTPWKASEKCWKKLI